MVTRCLQVSFPDWSSLPATSLKPFAANVIDILVNNCSLFPSIPLQPVDLSLAILTWGRPDSKFLNDYIADKRQKKFRNRLVVFSYPESRFVCSGRRTFLIHICSGSGFPGRAKMFASFERRRFGDIRSRTGYPFIHRFISTHLRHALHAYRMLK
jgi:hypothetical protein